MGMKQKYHQPFYEIVLDIQLFMHDIIVFVPRFDKSNFRNARSILLAHWMAI